MCKHNAIIVLADGRTKCLLCGETFETPKAPVEAPKTPVETAEPTKTDKPAPRKRAAKNGK